jgi:zinc protease
MARRPSSRRWATWLGLLAAVAVGALAFEATADSAGTLPTPIDRYQLQNGLRVILAPDAVSAGVSIVVRYEVGMAHEPRDYRGMSHLLEHLTFRGSRHLAPLEGMKILQRLGAGFNATTELEATSYVAQGPASGLETLLWIESERMAFTLDGLREPALAIEQRIVANELRQRGGLSMLVDQKWLAALYGHDHPFVPGEDVLGDVQAATLPGLQWFFQASYRPDNAVLALAGKLDPSETRRLVEKYFGPIRPAPVARVSVRAAPPKLCGVHRLGMSHGGLFGHELRFAWSLPVVSTPLERSTHDALAQLFERRLYDLLVEAAVDVSQVRVSLARLVTHQLLTVKLELHEKGSALAAEQVVLREARSLAKQAVDMRELRTVRANLITRQLFEREDGLRRATLLAAGRELELEEAAMRLLHPAHLLKAAAPLIGPTLIMHLWPEHQAGAAVFRVEQDHNPCR